MSVTEYHILKKYNYVKLGRKTNMNDSLELRIWLSFMLLLMIGIFVFWIGTHQLSDYAQEYEKSSEKWYIAKHQQWFAKKTVYQGSSPGYFSDWSQNIKIENSKYEPGSDNDPIRKTSPQIRLQSLTFAKKLQKATTNPNSKMEKFYLFAEQKKTYEQKYNISQYDELPICVVVPTYLNTEQDRYKLNIDSILQQQYQNFHVVVIDDACPEGTGYKIAQYIEGKTNKVSIYRNKERKMAMGNIWWAAENFCSPIQIMIILDGDDYLLGRQVFKLFNAAFQHHDSWLVYSNFLIGEKSGYSRPYPTQIIDNRQYRQVSFAISHLRAFYTKLLLLVDQQDLKDLSGEWLHAANDVAIYMPMLQMCGRKQTYLRELTYFYNSNTTNNNHATKRKQQLHNEHFIREKSPYPQIHQLFTFEELSLKKAKTLPSKHQTQSQRRQEPS